MFAELQNATSFYDFMHVDEFLKQTNVAATDAENEAFSSGFSTYIRSQFSYDLNSISGDYSLDDMANFLSKMMTEYGYGVSGQYERVMQVLAARDHEIECRADVQSDYWRDTAASERVDEEVISSMFDSLR
jgi:hypothetical protein